MRKIITNEQFNEALHNQNNLAIMGSACIPFRKSIDIDELDSIKLLSLWYAMKTWNPAGRKFSSYLYQQVRWNCIKNVQDKAKNPVYNMEFDRKTQKNDNFSELIEQLPENLQNIFISRFVKGMTLREIAREQGFCAETCRRRLLKGISILRENHQF